MAAPSLSLEQLADDPTKIAGLTEAQLASYIDRVFPYGKTVADASGYSCISVTLPKEQYLKQIVELAMVGLLYNNAENLDELYHLTSDEKTEDVKKVYKIKSLIIKDFLDHMFEYNPETHTSSSFFATPEHVEEKGTIVGAGKKDIIQHVEPEVYKPIEMTVDGQKYMSYDNGITFRIVIEDEPSVKMVGDKKCVSYDGWRTFSVIKDDKDIIHTKLKLHIPKYIPIAPASLFYQLDRYEAVNYDKLDAIARKLCPELRHIDWAVQVLKSFDGPTAESQASAYANSHASEYAYPITVIKNGEFKLMASYKQNRDRTSADDRHGDILARIAKRGKRDAEIGQELMKARIAREKLREYVVSGEEDKGLDEYASTMGQRSTGLTADDRKKLRERAKKIRESGAPKPMLDAEGDPADLCAVDFWITQNGKMVRRREYIGEYIPDAPDISSIPIPKSAPVSYIETAGPSAKTVEMPSGTGDAGGAAASATHS